MDHQVKVPDMGTTTDEIEIVEWLVAPGDTVTVGQELVNVETGKETL
jgi:pyruvate dehydrogenase E2 component (dihydrolipoamide acetyltransferase)|tara:strand:+ start:90 stop:230 length:141 start_codon:yes stop_codon:yes gene_type:complete